MNQRTISRFKLYPYGWLSPIPFEKNQPTVRCLRQRSFLANCMSPHASQSSPHIRPTCQCAPRSCHFCLNYWWTRKLAWVLVVGSFSSSFTGKKKHEETWSLSPGGYLISIIILSLECEKTSAGMSGCYKLVLTPHSSHLSPAAPGFFVRIFSNHCLPNRYRCF